MKNLKNRILLGFNIGVLVPTAIYFLSLWFYNFMTTDELIESFTTPKVWMLFVLIYFPILNLYVGKKLKVLAKYLEQPNLRDLERVQHIVAQLPMVFIFHVMVYATTGASSLLMFESYFTFTERVLALLLGFAFVFVYALPFFVSTVMLIERWTISIPISEKQKYLSIKGKLYISLLCNVFGVMVVIGVLNMGVLLSNSGTDVAELFKVLLGKNAIIGLSCLIIVGVNLLMLTRQLIKPIEDTTEMFKVISKGDLTKKINITSKDEIGILKHWIDRFVDKIHDVIGRVRQGAGQLDTSANTLVTNIDVIGVSLSDMSNAANQIASSTDDTCDTLSAVVESLNSLNESIREIAAHSMRASQQGQATVEVTQQGQQIVGETLDEMDYIRQEMTRLVLAIEKMGESVIQIERIVNIINGISRQTNMLAINASIESARAGEQGRSFKVVADSIGKLSEESKHSTEEITKLVAEIRENVQASIQMTKESVSKVEVGVELVKKTDGAFDTVYNAITTTTTLIHEIAVATERQANESKSIMRAIEKVNDMSLHVSALIQEQVASTEEVASTLEKMNSTSSDSTSQKLAKESKELYQLISQFKVEDKQ